MILIQFDFKKKLKNYEIIKINKKENGDVVVCYNSRGSNSVQHYTNVAGRNSVLMDSSNPTLGLSNFTVRNDNGNMVCSFTRENSNANNNRYLNLFNGATAHFIVAYGESTISNHKNNKYATPETYRFYSSFGVRQIPNKTIYLFFISLINIILFCF